MCYILFKNTLICKFHFLNWLNTNTKYVFEISKHLKYLKKWLRPLDRSTYGAAATFLFARHDKSPP